MESNNDTLCLSVHSLRLVCHFHYYETENASDPLNRATICHFTISIVYVSACFLKIFSAIENEGWVTRRGRVHDDLPSSREAGSVQEAPTCDPPQVDYCWLLFLLFISHHHPLHHFPPGRHVFGILPLTCAQGGIWSCNRRVFLWC